MDTVITFPPQPVKNILTQFLGLIFTDFPDNQSKNAIIQMIHNGLSQAGIEKVPGLGNIIQGLFSILRPGVNFNQE